MGLDRGKLSALKAAKLRAPGRYGDGGGLWLQVSGVGAKSWLFRYTIAGKARQMGLGSFSTITLAQAREAALEARRSVYAGIDPINAKRSTKTQALLETALAMTFKQCAQAYISSHEKSWRNQVHALQWPNSLRDYAYPLVGDLPVADINTGLVLKILQPIWETKSETASRIRMRIETVLSWATARGYRVGDNPARWKGHLDQLLPARRKMATVKHHAAMPYAEIGDFMPVLRAHQGIVARSMEFTILTAARTNEVVGAKWAEIDLSKGLWTIPGERMKAGREHRVALSKVAVRLLGELPREGQYVFPGAQKGKPLSNMAMLTMLKRMGFALTVHGFRSTFRDWASELTNFPRDLAEMALAHVIDDKTEAAYRRGDMLEKRRQLAEVWAQYCGKPSHNAGIVVTIRGARQ